LQRDKDVGYVGETHTKRSELRPGLDNFHHMGFSNYSWIASA